jgi:hypothetical protein
MMQRTLPLTLDRWDDPPRTSQSPRFLEVQAAVKNRDPARFDALQRMALRLAAERGDRGFSVNDLRRVPGWEAQTTGLRTRLARNLPGIVIGSLRSKHAICLIDRVKCAHPDGRGRWVGVYRLNGEAIKVSDP